MNVNVVVRNVSSYTLVYSTQISMEKRSARVIIGNNHRLGNSQLGMAVGKCPVGVSPVGIAPDTTADILLKKRLAEINSNLSRPWR